MTSVVPGKSPSKRRKTLVEDSAAIIINLDEEEKDEIAHSNLAEATPEKFTARDSKEKAFGALLED